MKIILFVLVSYGITNILVFGSIFEWLRVLLDKYNPKFLGSLIKCPLCLSTWVGALLSITFGYFGLSTPFTEYGITILPLLIFLDACFTSGCVWLIHTMQEFFEK